MAKLITIWKKMSETKSIEVQNFFFPFQMWEFMEGTRPSVFVKDYEEGITRVKGGGYAFLMESTVLQYKVQVSLIQILEFIMN